MLKEEEEKNDGIDDDDMGAVGVMTREKKKNHRWGNMRQMIGYIEQKRRKKNILTKISK
jgi:hypothetical protein